MRLASGPLHSRNFQLLLACDVISVAGSAIAVVAIPFAVLGIGGSAPDVGYVAAAGQLPVIAFLLFGGVIADRLPRHQVMVAANALQALAQAGSAVLVLAGVARVGELAGLAAARGVGLGFYFPAAAGLLPQTVPADQRAQANAMDRIGRNGAQIGGAALGGVLVGLAGPGWGLAADAASFAIAGALRAGMRFPARPPAQAPGVLAEMREGWLDFISRRWLWAIVGQFAFIVAIVTATESVLGPLTAQAHFGGPRGWGVILAGFAAGAVLGGAAMLRFHPRRLLLAATLAVPFLAVFLFALAIPLAVPLVTAAAVLAGGGMSVFGVNWATTLQQEIQPSMLSRISSYDALGSWALAPVGAAAAGPLATIFGPAAILDSAGILTVLLSAAVLFVPEVRQLSREASGPAARPDLLAES